MLELCGMRSTPSLPSLPGPLCLRVIAPHRDPSKGQIDLNCVIVVTPERVTNENTNTDIR